MADLIYCSAQILSVLVLFVKDFSSKTFRQAKHEILITNLDLHQVFVSILIPHLLIGLFPFALALAALQVSESCHCHPEGKCPKKIKRKLLQVFFSRSKCQEMQ